MRDEEFAALEELFDAIEAEGPGKKSERLEEALANAHRFVEEREKRRSEAA